MTKKPVMTFSELVYAIQNRGKTMNLKESKPMKLTKEETKVEEPAAEVITEPTVETVEEAKKPAKKKIHSYSDWQKAGSPVGGWSPSDHTAPIKTAKNVPGTKKK